jgi:hypothetical protein
MLMATSHWDDILILWYAIVTRWVDVTCVIRAMDVKTVEATQYCNAEQWAHLDSQTSISANENAI